MGSARTSIPATTCPRTIASGIASRHFYGERGKVDEEALDAMVPIVDVVGTAWTLAGRVRDPERFTDEAACRLISLENLRNAPQWMPR